MSGNSYLVIVGPKDVPLYQAEFGPQTLSDTNKEEPKHFNQFVVFSALDHVNEAMWATHSMNLKIVDSYEDWSVSAYVMPCGVQLLFLHDAIISANGENIKGFFSDCHETFVKYLLNPFVDVTTPITSSGFDQRIREVAKKWFT